MFSLVEQALLEKVRALPLERQQEVLDFAEFLLLKTKEPQEADVQAAISSPIDVQQLSGMLHQVGRHTVSLEEMEQAIAECAEESA
jgi:hypothetical protein